MNKEEARLYLEHTSKDDFNLEEWQKENRCQAIQVVLKEIEILHQELERYKNIVDKAIEVIENLDKEDINVWVENKYWVYVLDILKGVK